MGIPAATGTVRGQEARGQNISVSVLAESRGDHSYVTLRGGCPVPRELSFVYKLYPVFL